MDKIKSKQTINAFTIIEIMVVIIILGILAGFVIPMHTESIQKGYERQLILHLLSIHSANENYKNLSKDNRYLNAGTTDISTINNELGLAIIGSKMTFSYQVDTSDYQAYTATATYLSGSPGSFSLKVTEQDIADRTNPCCNSGSCKLVDNCS